MRSSVLVGVGVLGAVAAGIVGKRRVERATTGRIDRLLAAARTPAGDVDTDAALEGVPDPVRRYLDSTLDADRPPLRTVRIDQRGELRTGSGSPWRPFTATHHATVDPPGFVWDATVSLAPLLSVRVLDACEAGEGSALVSLLGAIPAGGADPTPELNEASLQRYLAEAVWYPAALLPGAGVEWEPIDDRSAEATLRCRGTTASLTFEFNDRDEVERVFAEERYRRVGDGFEPTPWSGHWRDYRVRDGVRVPTGGEVVWHLPEGDLHAWRGRVKSIEYRPVNG